MVEPSKGNYNIPGKYHALRKINDFTWILKRSEADFQTNFFGNIVKRPLKVEIDQLRVRRRGVIDAKTAIPCAHRE